MWPNTSIGRPAARTSKNPGAHDSDRTNLHRVAAKARLSQTKGRSKGIPDAASGKAHRQAGARRYPPGSAVVWSSANKRIPAPHDDACQLTLRLSRSVVARTGASKSRRSRCRARLYTDRAALETKSDEADHGLPHVARTWSDSGPLHDPQQEPGAEAPGP